MCVIYLIYPLHIIPILFTHSVLSLQCLFVSIKSMFLSGFIAVIHPPVTDFKHFLFFFTFVGDTKEPSLVLILKWGGELTPAGRIQAEELGRIFRCMYPGGQGTSRHDQSGTQGLGLLRLHSTFRHDLKIYASDEGRVQMTAAAFAKGLLALEGELTPILVQMVKSANTNGLLDNDCESSKVQNAYVFFIISI